MISIIIPTFNRAYIIRRTLNSVLNQTAQDWECIVVDDYSTDNTRVVVEDYIKKDQRFRYCLNERKKGAQGARNTGIIHAKGEWICLFDSDDIMYPNYLKVMGDAINENTDVVICKALIRNISNEQECDNMDMIYSENYHQDLFRLKCYVAYDVTIIRKEKLLVIGLLDENCPSIQEWDTHIRLSRIARYKAIDETLCEWHTGGEDAISTDRRREVKGHLYVLSKHRLEWKKDKEAIRSMVKQIYALSQETNDYWFRFISFVRLTLISPYAFRYAAGRGWRHVKRCLISMKFKR